MFTIQLIHPETDKLITIEELINWLIINTKSEKFKWKNRSGKNWYYIFKTMNKEIKFQVNPCTQSLMITDKHNPGIELFYIEPSNICDLINYAMFRDVWGP